MLIAYCEKCGFRIPNEHLEAGAALKVDEKYYCTKCASGMPKRPASKPGLTRQTPEHSSPPRIAETKVFAKPPSGEARIIPPAARTAPAPATGTRVQAPAPKAKNNGAIMIGGIAAGVLGLVLIIASMRKSDQNSQIADKDTTKPKTEEKTTAAPAPAKSIVSTASPVPTPASTPIVAAPLAAEPKADLNAAASLAERQKNADKDLENFRNERGNRLLEENKKWFADHPSDPWTYHDKLKQLSSMYRSSPAAREAEKILAELKLPEGERPPDSMSWHYDWNYVKGAQADMQENMDGRKCVLATHPVEGGKPFYMNRSMKVPADRPVLMFDIRAHWDGDFKLIAEINSKLLIEQDLRGPEWRSYAIDLSSIKGQDAMVSLQHHNTEWMNEHAWWTAPRFVSAAPPNAKVVNFDAVPAFDLPPGNLAHDPSFESGRKGMWDHWGPAQFVSSEARSGRYAARVGPEANSFEQRLSGLAPNTKYILVGWAKCPNGEDVQIGVKEHGGDQIHRPVSSKEYSRIAVPFTTGATNTTATIFFWKAGGTQVAFGDDFAVVPEGTALPAASAAPVASPAPVNTPPGAEARNWRALYDGKSLDCLVRQGYNGWRVENGALVNSGPEKTSAQTNFEIEDGSLRIRFEIKDAAYVQFTVRQGEGGGYVLAFNRATLPAMYGKPHEIIFTCRGDTVTATLDGQPTKVDTNRNPRKGKLQFYARDGTLHVQSIEYAELGAAPAPLASGAPGVKAVPHAATNAQAAAAPEARLAYEIVVAESYALLLKNSAPQAIAGLEKARADPALTAFGAALAQDIELARGVENSHAAIVKGVEALSDKRAFTFHKTDGKEFPVGKGTKNAVLGIRNNDIQLEQDLGGGKALSRIALDQLSPRTRNELLALGLPPGGESELKIAFGALLVLHGGGVDVSAREIRHRLELAEKGKAPAETIAHVRERVEAIEREIAAEAAFKKAEVLFRDKRMEEAKKALEKIKADFAGTRALERQKATIEQRLAEIEDILNPSRPGLWATFFAGDDGNRYKTAHLSRAEQKLLQDWGDNKPDEKVPNDFSIRYRGILRVEREGRYGFDVWGDDYASLWIDGNAVAGNVINKRDNEVTLTKGDHAIKIDYWDSGGGAKIEIKWRLVGGFDLQEIPVSVLWHIPKEIPKYEKE